MLSTSRRLRPTYSGITSTLALVVALGGGAYAATALPKNSVGTPQIKSGAVTSAKVAGNAIDGSKVANGTITGSDMAPNAIGLNQLAPSIQGRLTSPSPLYNWSQSVTPGTRTVSFGGIPAHSIVAGTSITVTPTGTPTCADERLTIDVVPQSSTPDAPLEASYGDPVAVWSSAQGQALSFGAGVAPAGGGILEANLSCASGSGLVDATFTLKLNIYTQTWSGTTVDIL